jgi:hypothetical protein
MWKSLWDIGWRNCNDKWMLMTLECIYGYGIVDNKYMWLCCELLDWEFVMIIWCWMDDLGSMRLGYKCDCVVESGIVERKMFGNTHVMICI